MTYQQLSQIIAVVNSNRIGSIEQLRDLLHKRKDLTFMMDLSKVIDKLYCKQYVR